MRNCIHPLAFIGSTAYDGKNTENWGVGARTRAHTPIFGPLSFVCESLGFLKIRIAAFCGCKIKVMQKVTKLIDIKAPCQEVFNTVANIEKRMQLSPLWGLSRLLEVSPNFPEPGSSYRVRVLTDKPFGLSQGTLNAHHSALAGLSQALFLKLGHLDPQDKIDSEPSGVIQPAKEIEQNPAGGTPVDQEYFIETYQPPYKFSYYLNEDCETIVTWSFQSIPFGTRINYEEVFCDDNVQDENFISTVQHVISEWLSNIKRYSELREGRGRKAVKWFLDRFYLKLRPDQRRVVLILLYLQAIGLGTFLVAAIGWGIASLFF